MIFRHLTRLQTVGDVSCLSLVPPSPGYPLPQYSIPLRRPYFIPSRPWLPGSAAISQLQKALEVFLRLRIRSTDHILSCLHEREHPFARRLAQLARARLTCLLHDRWPDRDHDSVLKTLRRTHRVFAVSENLAQLARACSGVEAEVLPPIGEDPLPPPRFSAHRVSVGLAGSLDSRYADLALRFGRPVLAVGWQGPAMTGLSAVPAFSANRDALVHLQENCAALLVCQNPADRRYCTYSFPSRFVDFSQTGLPLILVANPDSNLGRWAQAHHWRLWISDPSSDTAFSAITTALSDEVFWTAESQKSCALARGEFHADRIHAVLMKSLLG